MDKAIMLSVRPRWCEKIASGEKTIELRKTRPKLDTPFRCYIYCTDVKAMNLSEYVKIFANTGGAIDDWSGKVIGEFVCGWISTIVRAGYADPQLYVCHSDLSISPATDILRTTCLEPDEAKSYLKNGIGYGWHISELKIYDQPKELREFGVSRAPQSWQYVHIPEKHGGETQ